MPSVLTVAPASAGPAARAMLNVIELSPTADVTSSRGTSETKSACCAGVENALRRSEVAHERALARRADPWKRVEDRFSRLLVAPLTMEAEGEAVRLVADPLEQLQARGA